MENISRRAPAAVERIDTDDEMPPLAELAVVAGVSLDLSEEQLTDALNAMAGFSQPDVTSDTLAARLYEMVEIVQARGLEAPLHLAQACSRVEVAAARAELERRRGVGFVARVAAMGRPALAALSSILFVVLMLWANAAQAAAGLSFRVPTAHKIQRRNSAGLLPNRRKNRQHLPWRGWIRSKKSYGTSRRRSRSCRAFATGCAAGRVSCRGPGSASRSSWSGGSVAFASGVCPAPSPTSRSNVPTARLSARHGARAKEGSANANA